MIWYSRTTPAQEANRYSRPEFLAEVQAAVSVLEIGPFCSPCLQGPNVKYFDVLDRAGLEARAKQIGLSNFRAPDIDFVSETGDLATVSAKFAAAFSAHCIEHQPDLIKHLQDVARILQPGGSYYLIIPDKRYCFDHFIPESNIAGIVQAHAEARKVHSVASIIEHRALTTHNDPARHWKGDHFDPGFQEGQIQRVRLAMQEHAAANGAYVDVHAWQFTPESLREITADLKGLGLIEFDVEMIWPTPQGGIEFAAKLTKGLQRGH